MALRSATARLKLTYASSLSPSQPCFRHANSLSYLRSLQRNNSLQLRFQSTIQDGPIPPRPQLSASEQRTNRNIRRGLNLLGIVLAFSTGWMLANNNTVQTAVAVVTQPSDQQTLDMWKPKPGSMAEKIEAQLQAHPLVKALSADPQWQSSRPHLKIPPNLRDKSFTGGHLIADDKMPVPPIVFTTGDGKQLVSVVFLGTGVCGHPGIVHGGLLATLMDEGLARTCFAALPNKVGVTAHLEVDYRAPCRAGQFVVLRAETTKVEGRKAWVKGRLETLTADGGAGKLLVDGSALFIEPKGFASKLMRIAS